MPVVLTRDEVALVLGRPQGSWWLIGMLLYGAGLRQMECLRLRVKDVDFKRFEIVVRGGKGEKDRVTMLPEAAPHTFWDWEVRNPLDAQGAAEEDSPSRSDG